MVQLGDCNQLWCVNVHHHYYYHIKLLRRWIWYLDISLALIGLSAPRNDVQFCRICQEIHLQETDCLTGWATGDRQSISGEASNQQYIPWRNRVWLLQGVQNVKTILVLRTVNVYRVWWPTLILLTMPLLERQGCVRSVATFGFTFWSSSSSLIEEPHSVKCLWRNNDSIHIWKHLLIATSYRNLAWRMIYIYWQAYHVYNKCWRELTRQDMISFTRKPTNYMGSKYSVQSSQASILQPGHVFINQSSKRKDRKRRYKGT